MTTNLKRGVYVGKVPTVLEDGRPVAIGQTVTIDAGGPDARLLDHLDNVHDVEPDGDSDFVGTVQSFETVARNLGEDELAIYASGDSRKGIRDAATVELERRMAQSQEADS